ncbi:MAG: fluoride efflux transporter CrcB [Opitutus sp.]|nr:fluoride efflux transporter CrcB [Opitutus sp.]
MSPYFWIFLGSGLGGLARHAAAVFFLQRFGEMFPWGTFFVNVSGSFAIGFLASLAAPDGRPLLGPAARSFLMIGVLGGFTTYSSFSLQTLTLAREGEWLRAGGNALGTFALCFVAVWLGHLCAAWVNTLRSQS